MSRECGDCTACCTVLGVHELKKAPSTPCCHECATGCSTYESRPESCREFRCVWLDGAFEEHLRPDKLGLVITLAPTHHENHPWRRWVLSTEVEAGAARRGDTPQFLRWLTKKGEVVWVYGPETVLTGKGAQILYPDGHEHAIDPGVTFEQELEEIVALERGDDFIETIRRTGATPKPPPRRAAEWLQERRVRRVIERNKPIPALRRVFQSMVKRSMEAED
jgi:hypothetical protein